MPRLTTPKTLDHLVALIAATPDGIGIGIDRLLQAQGNSLQRRLASLVAQGRIQTVGEARAVRYICVPKPINISAAITGAGDTHQATIEIYVPTSPEGEAIKA